MAGFTQKFRAEVRAWLASLASRAGTKTHSPTSFTADVTRLCTDLPLKLVAWTLYGETLDDKVGSMGGPKERFGRLTISGVCGATAANRRSRRARLRLVSENSHDFQDLRLAADEEQPPAGTVRQTLS